jgi:hypothetical protein
MPSQEAESQRAHITLNPAGVAAPAQQIATLAAHVVATTLRALANDDLSSPEMRGSHIGYNFHGLEFPSDGRRVAYQNWILSKGFQDLARGIRETLEEACLYIRLLRDIEWPISWQELQKRGGAFKRQAAKAQFPRLLADVNAGLSEPMAFEAEFLSLQKARNCLEHRGGRVGPSDVDPDTGALTLTFPRIRIFYRHGDEEVELMPGEVIDTHDPGNPFGEGQEVEIFMQRVTRSRDYVLGDLVTISASDFYEIAFACHLFAGDLAAKLPKAANGSPAAPLK